MADVRIVISDDLLQMEAWEPQPAGFPGKPHREKYELQQAGDVSWLVAWMDDRPCGSVTITWPESSGEHTEQGRSLGCAEIGGLGVDEELRGQGIGRALMEAAEELARKRGVLLLGLEVTATNPNQDAARALYSKLAYEDAGFGEFISGYTYWDPDGDPHREEELHRYLVKRL
jgi:ribosomal protein S18 acetylase RimI-like enzyme